MMNSNDESAAPSHSATRSGVFLTSLHLNAFQNIIRLNREVGEVECDSFV